MRINTNSDSIRNPQSAIRNSRNPQSAIRNLLDRSIAAGLMAAVVFTTLALGTVEAWSVAIFELIVLVLIVLWASKAILDKRLEIVIPSAAWPLVAFVSLGLIQSVAITGADGRTRSMSMDVEATRGAVAVIFFLLVCFLIAANSFSSPERLRVLANFLIIFGLLLAVFALIQHFTWEGRLFWLRPSKTANGMGGPFVNRNHFAGYMEMLIPIPLALVLSRAARGEARLFYGFAAAIMGIAEVASLSRGGWVSLACGLFFVGTLSVLRKRRNSAGGRESALIRRPAFPIVITLAAIIAGVIWVGADFDILRRLANDPLTTSQVTDRGSVWGDTLTMFRAHPIFGVGLGAFETVYPIYGRGDGTFLIQFAHNDFLQVLSDGGIIGGALAVWFIAAVFRAVKHGLMSEDPLLSGLALGAGAGIFAMLVHSFFDFNLQIPSNALLFLTLAAAVSIIGMPHAARIENGAHNDERDRLRRRRAGTKDQQVVTAVKL